MWFETHAHLSDPKFDADRDHVIENAFSAGLSAIIEIADGPAEWPKAQKLARQHKGKLWWAAGIHPYYADQATPAVWNSLKELTSDGQFVAIGEVGLDYAKCPIPRETQIETFRSALTLAQDVKKPLIIHCRDAYADLMPILREVFPKAGSQSPGVVHCFSGNQENAAELVSLGFYLGVDGPLTYPNAKELRHALSGIPLENLVLETDSPYLPPQSRRGQRNEPRCLVEVGEHLAYLRHSTPTDIAAVTRENALKLFRLN